MSDAPTEPRENELEYYRASGPAPLHPAVLALCTIAGAIVGGGVMLVAGGLGLGALMSGYGPSHAKVAAAIAFLAAAAFMTWWIVKLYKGRSLAIEARRRGGRFFLSGFLIGCGVICLLEGICFSAA